jgi:hypothetical protein
VTKDQDERLVAAWEALAAGLGALNETARAAIAKQWPDPRTPREAVFSKLPTAEEKLKAATGNTDGPVADWLGEFPDEELEEEIGPREREFLAGAGKSKSTPRTQTSS